MEDRELETSNPEQVPEAIPTIAETYKAKRIYLKGMSHHYPGVDPRMGLLGMKENPSYEYETVGYGNQLVRVPGKTTLLINSLISKVKISCGIGILVYSCIQLIKEL